MQLGDGRVGAFIVEHNAGRLGTAYVIVERQGDRLLAGEFFDFVPTESSCRGAAVTADCR